MVHLYLSPHLDDAALSCGGLIHRQARAGERVVVATVCAGDPPPGPLSEFAQSLHTRWGLSGPEAAAARRREDLAALQALGAEALHLAEVDCIYRSEQSTGAHLYSSEAALFGEVHLADADLEARLTSHFEALCARLQATHVYVPLGIGHHVDHQLTRQAAERLGRPLVFVEDYPYAARVPQTTDWDGLAQGLLPYYEQFREADLEAYCQAVALYRSQISTFWPDEAGLRQALRAFASQARPGALGLRLWRAR